MYLLGYSLDNLSLMALTLSVGFVVDDAIVMLENIVRHMEMGEGRLRGGPRRLEGDRLHDPLDDALAGRRLHPGPLHGRHRRAALPRVRRHDRRRDPRLGLRLADADADALQPLPQAPRRSVRHGPALRRASSGVFDGDARLLRDGACAGSSSTAPDDRLLGARPRSPRSSSSRTIPKGFLPSEDTGQIFGFTEAAAGDLVRGDGRAPEGGRPRSSEADPNVDGFMSSCGAAATASARATPGSVFARLKPRSERKLEPPTRSSRGCGRKLAQIPGIRVFLQNPPPIRIGGALTKSQYQYTLQGPDTDELYRVGAAARAEDARAARACRTSPATCSSRTRRSYVDDRPRPGGRARRHRRRRSRTRSTRPTARARSRRSTRRTTSTRSSWSCARSSSATRRPSRSSTSARRSGELVPLAAVAKLEPDVGPARGQPRGPAPVGDDLLQPRARASRSATPSAAVDQARARDPPRDDQTSFQGTAQAFQSSLQGLGLLLLVAILVIYMVLGILYESFLHPLTILSALPFAGFGALADAPRLQDGAVDLRLRRHHHARRPREEERHHDGRLRPRGAARRGRTPRTAIYEACVVRFRPIMMTTMAALMGTLPIALGFGAGRRVAPAARPRGRRRPPLLADPHALRHAGLLRLHGGAPRAARQPARGEAGGRGRGGRGLTRAERRRSARRLSSGGWPSSP